MLVNARKFIDSTKYKDFPYDAESMESEFLQMMEDGLTVIAEHDGVHLGGAGAVKGPLFFNRAVSIAYERFFWVEPGERAGGVGKALFAALKAASKAAGCRYRNMIALENEAFPYVDALYRKDGLELAEHSYIGEL
jgi:GNAT superfamily N-acetyltransferase